MELKICISDFVPPWLSPVERLAVNQPIKNGEQPFTIGEDRNQSVKGSNPFGGATLNAKKLPVFSFFNLRLPV
jgi:hypothetical protein